MSGKYLYQVQFIAWGFILVALWGISFWKFQPQENPIYLHYNVYFGIDWVGPWYLGYLIPLSATLLVGINYMCIRYALKTNEAIATIFLFWSSLALCFLAMSHILVVLLNG